ncbi:helix-turn-helix transcriptional regulator [Arsenicicoccus dermatophilus]|uniref:helix-turn-helix transcriptional regulator n=1 Tax=Arsenicicoccus dermatophilus TaxID=1076331 RepID=UPI001F4C6199|nr:metalloregulator ArsR/SmtB family transcription factor [Arsenicicoccus dermatophilus]MCH8612574.1 transcriptional regulator [Arsenicicoccus dermatophilus]
MAKPSALTSPADSSTRARVQQGVSEHGPVTAASLAEMLDITPTAVRRHLDALEGAGLITARTAAGTSRGRGRPARAYVLTDAGHRALDASYDDVATSALRFLHEQVGEHAVEAFATQHVARLEERYRDRVRAAGDDPEARARVLAEVLTQDGYAASSRPVALADGTTTLGVQLCQGHCPVQQVASEFPQFCDAERKAFGRLLGVHVQRLATLAHGEHVCTTFVPVGAGSSRHAPGAAAPPDPPPDAPAPDRPDHAPPPQTPDHDERSTR